MALIKCPECGKEVSDASETCVHCGYPLKKKSSGSAFDIPPVSYEENFKPSSSNEPRYVGASNRKIRTRGFKKIISGIASILLSIPFFSAYSATSERMGDSAKILLVVGIILIIVGVITITIEILRFFKKR